MYFSSINLGQYYPADSFIHRLDPRAKLFALLIIVSAVFPAKSPVALVIWILTLIAIVKLSNVPFRVVIKSARPIFFLIAFTFIFNLIATAWHGDFKKAILISLFTSSRLLILMLFAVMLPLTTTPLSLADGIEYLLHPLSKFGFPSEECALMVGMSLRFIPLLMTETDKIIKAQLSRGADLDQGNIFKRVMAFFPVLIPLFIIIFRRADDIAIAMEARGYTGGQGRTRRKPLVWKFFNDTLVILLVIAFVAGVLYFL